MNALNYKTLEVLRDIINGDEVQDGYRTGSALVKFFNRLGFNNSYDTGFPSRKDYTDEMLNRINGTPQMDECIKNVFAVNEYIERKEVLDDLICKFNKYACFDGFKVIRKNTQILLAKADEPIFEPEKQEATRDSEKQQFLSTQFSANVSSLGLESMISQIINHRIEEIKSCMKGGCYLSAVVMIGGVLEGILLGTANANPHLFNRTQSTPKCQQDGKPKPFYEWNLANFIDVACDADFLKLDVKKFSHILREFRNYIHPYQQMQAQFSPDEHTASLCFQVLKAAICQISDKTKQLKG